MQSVAILEKAIKLLQRQQTRWEEILVNGSLVARIDGAGVVTVRIIVTLTVVVNIMLCNKKKKVDIKTSSIYYLQNKFYNISYNSDTKAFRLPSHLSNAFTDTGASGNYAPESALQYMVNKRAHKDDPLSRPIEVELSNGQIIRIDTHGRAKPSYHPRSCTENSHIS